MSDINNDMNHAVLNLSDEEKRAFSYLFDLADTDKIGVVTGERAVSFFEPTRVQPQVLGEIWQIADTENRGFLSKPGFCIVLRLIGHYQSGRAPTSELAFKSGPIPRFIGLQIPGPPAPTSPSQGSFPAATALVAQNSGQGIRIPPLDPQKVAQYSALFDGQGAQNGLLDGQTAKSIFEKAGLPVEVLGKIWMLSDRGQRGALDQTEFIVAMHLLTSFKSKAMTGLPNTLPQGFYDAAARRGAPPPPPQARQPAVVARQLTGNSVGAPVRTSSPLARNAGFGAPPPSGPAWLIAPAEKTKYDQFFSNLDPQGRGVLSGEQAAAFFGDSGLNEDTLASIWDLADINSEGQLNRDEFAVAMFLIKQQRSANPAPLPAFLPAALIPPSMRKPNLQQQTQQTTAPAFEAPSKPKSAADDLFGLDEPAAPVQPTLAPQNSQPRDPFAASTPSSPASPARFQPTAQPNTTFKPFMPTSAFGASLTSQGTGTSQTAAPRAAPSAMDDLLGDDSAESNKVTNESTELANMSSQIGNLRSQMEDTQAKKTTAQTDLGTTSTQKRELETRLAQFRAQYEQEVRTVKDLEQQLAQSKDSTKKLGQELALLEGAYQDLQTQHQSIAQALQADQTENANLKQRISQLNAEVAQLKPEIEKMKLDARQQKGMVSINKKQVATNEAERDRLTSEKDDLEREAVAAQARIASPEPIPATRDISNPAGSAISSTNPFFRSSSNEAVKTAGAPTPNASAFDQLFGPSFAETARTTAPPPATSFGRTHNAGLAESMSSDGKLTPAATPPPVDTRELPVVAEPPPPPLSRQFTPEQLPVGGIVDKSAADKDETASTSVIPPASRAGDHSDFGSERASTPAVLGDSVPGAFPDDSAAAEAPVDKVASDFDSAFADFGAREASKEHGSAFDEAFPAVPTTKSDPFGAFPAPPTTGLSSEFPPIRSLEHDDEDSDSDEEPQQVEASRTATEPVPRTSETASTTAESLPQPPKITAQSSPPPYDQSEAAHESAEPSAFPKEFTGLLPSREDPISPPAQPEPALEEPTTPKALPQRQVSFPTTSEPVSATTTVATNDIFHDASSRPTSEFTDAHEPAAPKNAFDEFDDFEDLSEAQEADASGPAFDFGFGHSRGPSEFDAAFDSPAASTTNTTRTGTAASGVFGSSINGASNSPFAPGASASSIQNTPEAKHDWDAIFSGLDNSTVGNLDTSLDDSDPWQPTASTNGKAPALAPPKGPVTGGAITPGDEHDDPILKRLTGMGYSRSTAVSALERYDYDINRAIDHLSNK